MLACAGAKLSNANRFQLKKVLVIEKGGGGFEWGKYTSPCCRPFRAQPLMNMDVTGFPIVSLMYHKSA